jgi:UDP-sulfoquinovose synthase
VIGHPLTIYGSGTQQRGFLPLRDSMQCLTLAVENPPDVGEYRVFNQFQECFSIIELAEIVQRVARSCGLDVDIQHYENPRHESESHYYNPDFKGLAELGYQPSHDVATEVQIMLQTLRTHRAIIEARADILIPDIRWDGQAQRSSKIDDNS